MRHQMRMPLSELSPEDQRTVKTEYQRALVVEGETEFVSMLDLPREYHKSLATKALRAQGYRGRRLKETVGNIDRAYVLFNRANKSSEN